MSDRYIYPLQLSPPRPSYLVTRQKSTALSFLPSTVHLLICWHWFMYDILYELFVYAFKLLTDCPVHYSYWRPQNVSMNKCLVLQFRGLTMLWATIKSTATRFAGGTAWKQMFWHWNRTPLLEHALSHLSCNTPFLQYAFRHLNLHIPFLEYSVNNLKRNLPLFQYDVRPLYSTHSTSFSILIFLWLFLLYLPVFLFSKRPVF